MILYEKHKFCLNLIFLADPKSCIPYVHISLTVLQIKSNLKVFFVLFIKPLLLHIIAQ